MKPPTYKITQSRLQSMVEVCTNTAIGYSVALMSQLVIFPLYDIHVPMTTNLGIGAWFTVVSIVRSYIVRRYFNKLLYRRH